MDGGVSFQVDQAKHQFEVSTAVDQMMQALVKSNDPLRDAYISLLRYDKSDNVTAFLKSREANMAKANAVAAAFRRNPRAAQFPKLSDLMKSNPALAKANLDVGTLTNFANITGGQSLGYVSLDTQMARGTVRPSSFTLYQSLHKTHAFQVVDYWAYASDTGGGLPGTAFASFASVGTGTLSTSAGKYQLQNLLLKLGVNGRALTTALAAQNSFVDVAMQENANAALTVLETFNWSSYWGDSSFYANQFNGIFKQLPAKNIVDYQGWFNANASAQGWSQAQALFNLIYQWSAQITSYNQFGRITHAFMTPFAAGSLQGLATTVLNNIVTAITGNMEQPTGIIVNGDLQGIRTRFGEIMFPIDLFIGVRDRPAQAIVMGDGTTFATTTAPTPPASVTPTLQTNQAGSAWTGAYVATGQFTQYAVASCDASMNESNLTWATPISGVAAAGAIQVAIAGPAAADAAAFRVYRAGLTTVSTGASGNPASVRFIGTIAASGSGTVNFQDLNTKIPGSETIFLLDLDENDMAVDFRYLLPLTKIELFAQNLYMPWAVAAIGAVRLRIPKFNAAIVNYVGDNPTFNPLASTANAI